MAEKNGKNSSFHCDDKLLGVQLNAIIDSSFDGLWICDGEGRVIKINRASEEINNIKAEDVLNKKMEDLVKQGFIDRSVTIEVLKTRTAVTMVQKLKNGKQVLVTGNPVFGKNGEIDLVVVNDRDITELNKLRAKLDKTRALSQEYRFKLSRLDIKKDLFSDLVIRNEVMYRVFNRAMKVAKADSIVLIQGESGVGKGLFASLVHKASKRKEGPFIRVDCSAIPESLIESELFGYKGGAFTGAMANGKPGHFEMAEGGTLFLDEIGELSLGIQVKLLRFIEENEVVPLGGTASKKIDARIIAATNRDLDDMLKNATFRRDLFFRLNVVPLKIPPLRERSEDIPSLVHYFLNKFNSKFKTHKTIRPRAVDALCRYSFPGNIRELANLIERFVVLSSENEITSEDLPSHVTHEVTERTINKTENGWDLRKSVEMLEREIITRALNEFGSQRKAAVPLGINQSTLARKISRYGIRNDVKLHHDA